MSIQLKDLLNAEVKKKLENLEKNPKAKLPKQKKNKKQPLNENKGTDLADKVISAFRSKLNAKDRNGKRVYNDDEVYAFSQRIADAIGAKLD
jgi:alkyl sulfatase BDS1-like metallo-beta-lactamase superfamily hydrolase